MILILDDDHDFVMTIRDVLLKLGVSVVATTDPFEAIGVLRTKKITQVVTDFHMPLMNGVEFCENVRQIDPEIRRIILTGYDENTELKKAKIDNVVNIVALKPIDRQGLINLITIN